MLCTLAVLFDVQAGYKVVDVGVGQYIARSRLSTLTSPVLWDATCASIMIR
jgi:hypothetical protein